MEDNCLAYNKMILLVALVSICVLGFESVIKFIGCTLKIVYDKLILNLLAVSTVEVIPMLQLCSKDYTEILSRGEICTHKTHIHDRSLSRLCT
jgi:hypothetical protein